MRRLDTVRAADDIARAVSGLAVELRTVDSALTGILGAYGDPDGELPPERPAEPSAGH